MDILTDAEYSRLTPIEKAQYWNNRYQDLEEKYEQLKVETYRLWRTIDEIDTAIETVRGSVSS